MSKTLLITILKKNTKNNIKKKTQNKINSEINIVHVLKNIVSIFLIFFFVNF